MSHDTSLDFRRKIIKVQNDKITELMLDANFTFHIPYICYKALYKTTFYENNQVFIQMYSLLFLPLLPPVVFSLNFFFSSFLFYYPSDLLFVSSIIFSIK